MSRPSCKECQGKGEVEFTKERGGPICNSCGGHGYLTDRILQRIIAAQIDYPSVYMGGPSPASLKKANNIIDILKKEGFISDES